MAIVTNRLFCFILTVAFFSNGDCQTRQVRDIQDRINELHNMIEEMQIKKTTTFFPPLFWGKTKGVYESDVKQYFHGRPEMHFLREKFKIFDNNMFATALVTTTLLEAYKFRHGPKLRETHVKMALAAVSEHYNRNYNFSNSIMTFWRQKYNVSTGVWVCAPDNLVDFFKMTSDIPWSVLEALLHDLGMDDVVEVIKFLLSTRDMYFRAFQVPPDFDDTFVNIGIGTLLKEMASDFPESHAFWMSKNTNLTFIFDELKRVAYRPFSPDGRINTIDTRTYFYIRDFLETAQAESRDLALIPSWVQDLNDVRKYAGKGNVIPGNINNVDLTVAANVIYGTTNAILTGLLNASILDDMDVQQIYLNTSTLISHEIMTNLSNRKDLALTYYPSEFEFYWFVARTFGQLERRVKMRTLPHPAMERVRRLFGVALRGYAYKAIVNKSKGDGDDKLYFDDFIGDGDRSWCNKTKIRGEDRIFTTSMAVNALITVWTVYDDSTQKLIWDKATPSLVKDTVRKSVNWLYDNVLRGRYKPWNAMFTGSFRGFTTVGLWYPMNRYEFANGTAITNTSQMPDSNTIMGVQGVACESWYQEQLKEKHFGFYTPQVFHGYNADNPLGLVFPFWSSEPYTFASTLLALTNYLSVI